MKDSKKIFPFTALLAIVTFCGCVRDKKDLVTTLPITTPSKEAMETCQQGLVMVDQNDGQQARTLFAKAIEQDPKLAIAYILKAGLDITPLESSEDMKKAKENLDGKSDWEKWYYEYTQTFFTSDWNKRLEITKKIAEAYPDAPRAQVDLGFTYESGNDETKARECFQKAIDLDPKWVGGYAAFSNSYLFFEPKDFKKAEEYALKVVELAPSSPGAEIALGDCYRAQQDLQKARDAYSKAIGLDPEASAAYYKKGHANTFMGNLDEARQNYMDGRSHDVSKTFSNQLVAYTYLYGGDYKAALKWLMDESNKSDSSGESSNKINNDKLTYMGDCEFIAMHNGDVEALKNLITETEPISAQAENDLGTQEEKLNQKANMVYWESLLATMEGNYDDAKAKAEQIKTILEPITDPNKLYPYEFAMGYLAMKQKNYPDAISHLEKSNMASVYDKYWLALANEAAGNVDKANQLFKEISNYNFNVIDYALIRNEVKSKTAATI